MSAVARRVALSFALEGATIAGVVLLWLAVTAHLGAGKAATLIAGNMILLAALGLTGVMTRTALRHRRNAAPAIRRATFRRAWAIEAASALLGSAVGALIVTAYAALGHHELVLPAAIQLIGLPARYAGPIRQRFRRQWTYRLLRNWCGVALVLLAILGDAAMPAVAMALAAREWLAILLLAVLPTRPARGIVAPAAVPPWSEFIAASASASSRRLSYHLGKSALGLLGPFGSLSARLSRRLPRRPAAVRLQHPRRLTGAIAGGAAAIAATVAAFGHGPGAVLTSATAVRIACLGLSAALWNRLRQDVPVADDTASDGVQSED